MNSTKETVNTFKGIMIIFIVIGHNTFLSSLTPSLWRFLYSFHVLCFLFLPFLYSVKELNKESILNNFVRYYIPSFWASLVSFLLFSIISFVPLSMYSIAKYIQSIVIGSALLFDESTGFQLFWFLPALFSLILLKNLFFSLNALTKTLIIIIFTFSHIVVGNLSPFWIKYTPIGLHIVSYLFILCLLVYWVYLKINGKNAKIVIFISLFLFIIFSLISHNYRTFINVGVLKIYSLKNNFFALLLHDLIAISAFFFFFYISKYLVKIKLLAIFGQNSLLIFLTHSLVFYGLLSLIKKANLESNIFLLAIISIIATLFFSLLIARSIHGNDLLRKLVTPRNWEEFKSVFTR